MGFCSEADVKEFFRTVPKFERHLDPLRHDFDQVLVLDHRRGATVSRPDAHPRSAEAVEAEPHGLGARRRWETYTRVKEEMFHRASIPEARWWMIPGNDKKRARLNCVAHLLTQVPYEEIPHESVVLPERIRLPGYEREDNSGREVPQLFFSERSPLSSLPYRPPLFSFIFSLIRRVTLGSGISPDLLTYLFRPGWSHRPSPAGAVRGTLHPGRGSGRRTSMPISLHKQATTTPKVRAAIQASDEPA